LIVLVDALDQLSNQNQARNLGWLPRDLPPHARLIVSTLTGEGVSDLQLSWPATRFVALATLSRAEVTGIVDAWLHDSRRSASTALGSSHSSRRRVSIFLAAIFEDCSPRGTVVF
jgi:hypothetical protein